VGDMSPDMEDEALFWRLVFEGNQSVIEVDQWDMPTMQSAIQFLLMKNDYTTAQSIALKPKKSDKGRR